MKRKIDIIKIGMGTVFRRPGYVAAAALVAAGVFLAALMLASASLLKFILASDLYPAGEKLSLVFRTLGGSLDVFHESSLTLVVLIAALFGVNMAMVAYYLKHRIAVERSVGTSLLGIVVGLLGIGCAACGSVVLTALFGAGATLGVIGALPLHGMEFSLLGVFLLGLSIYLTSKKVSDPAVCAIPKKM